MELSWVFPEVNVPVIPVPSLVYDTILNLIRDICRFMIKFTFQSFPLIVSVDVPMRASFPLLTVKPFPVSVTALLKHIKV